RLVQRRRPVRPLLRPVVDPELGVDRLKQLHPARLESVTDLVDDTLGELGADPLSDTLPVDRDNSGAAEHERTDEPSRYRLNRQLHQPPNLLAIAAITSSTDGPATSARALRISSRTVGMSTRSVYRTRKL